ncbi:hypothetical protein PSSHI_45030 [Photobacterium sp. R1]
MKLSDVATIKTNFPDADFWIVRRGSLKSVGQPVQEFNPEHIGVRVDRTDLLLPRYLYYCFEAIHLERKWEPLTTGTLSLVNIRVSDIRSIELCPR